MKTKFHSKGYGRIYTDKPEHVEEIEKTIKEMDEFEYEYMPDGLVTTFDGSIQNIYTGKFDDLDLEELMVRCWSKGIYSFYSMAVNE